MNVIKVKYLLSDYCKVCDCWVWDNKLMSKEVSGFMNAIIMVQ